ncbi:MAG: T9SS type A sorting domain-containing protein, partial [Gammaproteobacteria bacterium]|nr:T9SS type A sorting domain-containing protein [Gammaproteobacteria bacterium]
MTVSSDGTIFLANGDDGLIAYDYSQITSVKQTEMPKSYKLSQNYPNPFNPTTSISYQLPQTSDVDLSIYNLLGQKVATLVSKKQPAGSHKVEWDATGFASG